MIYIKSLDLVFIKPRKVAGTSFEIALSHFCGPNDIITPLSCIDEDRRFRKTGLTPKNYKYSPGDIFDFKLYKTLYDRVLYNKRLQKFYNHMSAKEILFVLGEREWNKAKKISIVRDPLDYVISYYYHAPIRNISFDKWYIENRETIKRVTESYYIGQEYILDYVIEYSHMAASLKHIENIFEPLKGISDMMLSCYTKSGRRPKESKNIGEFYSEFPEIKQFIINDFEMVYNILGVKCC